MSVIDRCNNIVAVSTCEGISLPEDWSAWHVRYPTRREPTEVLAEATCEPLSFVCGAGAAASPVERVLTDNTIDLMPLTVPRGFEYCRDIALLRTTMTCPDKLTLGITAGADWFMAWFCNGNLVHETFTHNGNGVRPPSVFDHQFALPLMAGANTLEVLVMSGGSGFKLHAAAYTHQIKAAHASQTAERMKKREQLRLKLQQSACVRVDAAIDLGPWSRPEKHHCISLGMAEDTALAAAVREVGPFEVVRAFSATRYLGNDKPLGDDIRRRLRNISKASREVMFVLNSIEPRLVLSSESAGRLYVNRLVEDILRIRADAPNAVWMEVFNESECGQKHIDIDDYYALYRLACEAATLADQQLPNLPALRVGGPCPCSFDVRRIGRFLDHFAADTWSGKRLEFVSYHQYLFGREHQPITVGDELSTLREMLRTRGLDSNLPIHVNESGLFPTNLGSSDVAADMLTQCTGVLTLHKQYLDQGSQVRPYMWTWFHHNPRKNLFVPTRERMLPTNHHEAIANADARAHVLPFCDERADRFTAFGHMNRLLSRLGSRRVSCQAMPTNDDGLGLHAIATADNRSVDLLLWSYGYTNLADLPDYDVPVDIAHTALQGELLLEITRIDINHGNYLTGDRPPLVQSERITVTDGTLRHRLQLPRNAVALLSWRRA